MLEQEINSKKHGQTCDNKTNDQQSAALSTDIEWKSKEIKHLQEIPRNDGFEWCWLLKLNKCFELAHSV